MNKLQQLTENSWTFKRSDGSFGLIFYTGESYTYMSATNQFAFNNLEELKSKFGKYEVVDSTAKKIVKDIKGYPVRHNDEITIITESPPTYHIGGNTEFAAGHWAIKFPKGWTMVLCPKVKTTTEYRCEGPFKTRMELSSHLSMTNLKEAINDSGQ